MLKVSTQHFAVGVVAAAAMFGGGMALENSADVFKGGSVRLKSAPPPCVEVGDIPLSVIPSEDVTFTFPEELRRAGPREL